MEDWATALNLLEAIWYKGRFEEEDRIPAWRAIQLLWRCGVPNDDCEELIVGVKRINMKQTNGPTLMYDTDRVRLKLERGEVGPRV